MFLVGFDVILHLLALLLQVLGKLFVDVLEQFHGIRFQLLLRFLELLHHFFTRRLGKRTGKDLGRDTLRGP